MAHQKHLLHELLQEDQEPFQLKNYIADRRCQLKRSSPNTQLQVKKRKPLSQTSNFTSNFCKNACLFSFQDSPDPRKSPLFEFQSPAKTPSRSPNAIFLHIPARTAALLLEAAHRIQKQSSKPKTQNKNASFSLFGSLRKKLTHRNKTRKLESSSGDGVKVSVKDILRWDSSVGRSKASNETFKEHMVGVEEKSASEKSACEMGFSCSCDGRPSSAVWSESNEDKSLDLDLETSCSSQCEDYFGEEIEFVSNDRENGDFDSCEKHCCESPFRFVLQKSPSSGHRTPDFSSPATSPNRYKKEDKESHDIEILKKLQVKEEEEEEKEQCSPVSVLDPPFEDDEEDDDDEDEGHDDEDDEDGFDLECSYAIVQRAKQQLLHKLCRFEKLAELDPIELEKRMLEQEEDDDDDTDNDTNDLEEEEGSEDYGSNVDGFLKQVVSQSDYHYQRRIPEDMKRLMTDLIAEEEREQNWSDDREGVVKRVCRRLESWKEVESNTIDMMVEQDIRKQLDGWKRNDQEQVGETASEIELAIFGLLMEELSEELVV
ncbi:hypothetical protein LWI28_013362 [Acer negundo]|uniref:DUF4378 domain-containing protein n=1 Tax=Acer negundo TaxID=4023 RepID=A0AAD5I640_ACENE|nr:hypothetical protein LWI28_013362 [Acer negundo]